MTFIPSFDISSSGLNAQRIRMDISSSNMANAQTTNGPDGGPYKKLSPIFNTREMEFNTHLEDQTSLQLQKVNYAGVQKDASNPRRVYDPGHPDADDNGFVAYPNINLMEEMANMLLASRAYEANISAFNMSKTMAMSALDLGKV